MWTGDDSMGGAMHRWPGLSDVAARSPARRSNVCSGGASIGVVHSAANEANEQITAQNTP